MEIYNSIYDIVEHGYAGWRFAVPGLFLFAFGLVFWSISFFGGKLVKSLGKAFCVFSILWCVGALSLSYKTHKDAIRAYQSGEYEVYFGVIEALEKKLGEATVETYKVGDKKLWDDNLPIGQRTIQPHLPSLENEVGSTLRIYYAKGLVLKIEKLVQPH